LAALVSINDYKYENLNMTESINIKKGLHPPKY